MSFLRKASLSKKKRDSGDSPSPRSTSSGPGSKPPKSRVVSDASSVSVDDEHRAGRRKISITGKGRKRLSSLFSSSTSLASLDRDPPGSTHRGSSLAQGGVSAPSSGASTPTRNGGHPLKSFVPNGKDTDSVASGVRDVSLPTSSTAVADSPESVSPVTATTGTDAPITPRSPADVEAIRRRRERSTSLYSQWDEEGDETTDDEDPAFLTPSEGLSEVEEGDEEAEAAEERNVEQHNVAKGTSASGQDDVLGTGPSTIHRALPTVTKTEVQRRPNVHASKAGALSVDQAKVLAGDIDTCREILSLFLTSKMKEAEDLSYERNPEGNRLYLQSAQSIIDGLKGMMTFDANDLANALEVCKGTAVTAAALRKPSDSIVTRLGGLVKSGAGVGRVKAMTVVERHAELVYAETTLMKAMLAIIGGGDWLGLVREALNLRSAHGIYRTLQQFLEEADSDGFDEDIDMDFRSGVLLGTGTSSLMLSLLPGKVLKIAEVFGYAGDRKVALATLYAAGGWHKGQDQPSYDETNEGVRRPVCDIILLAFHLVIPVLMPVAGVDVASARDILAYNLRRYPDGIFFLYFQARLHTMQCEPEEANKSLQRALEQKLEYLQLQHMCLWDYACNFMMLSNWKGALDCFSILKDESNWSRAVYTYSAAACLVELAEDRPGDEKFTARLTQEADLLMKNIPKLTKKIAGKSLPIEKKLAGRKARKFEAQGKTLFLPAMELAYVFGALGHTPRHALLSKTVPRIDKMLAKLEASSPEKYGNGHQYWDDYCLGHFLRGVANFAARYQPLEAVPAAKSPSPGEPSDADIDAAAERDMLLCIEHSPKVQLDHYIIFHCHYELGKLYARRGDTERAKKNFDVVMSGKLQEHNQYMAQAHGKYSLEGALMLKTHAAIQSLKEQESQ